MYHLYELAYKFINDHRVGTAWGIVTRKKLLLRKGPWKRYDRDIIRGEMLILEQVLRFVCYHYSSVLFTWEEISGLSLMLFAVNLFCLFG